MSEGDGSSRQSRMRQEVTCAVGRIDALASREDE